MQERVHLSSTFTSQFIIKEKEQEWARAGRQSWYRHHGEVLLPGLFLRACSGLAYTPRTSSSGMVPPTTSITNWCATGLDITPACGGIFLIFLKRLHRLSHWHKTSQHNWPLVNLTYKHITGKARPFLYLFIPTVTVIWTSQYKKLQFLSSDTVFKHSIT